MCGCRPHHQAFLGQPCHSCALLRRSSSPAGGPPGRSGRRRCAPPWLRLGSCGRRRCPRTAGRSPTRCPTAWNCVCHGTGGCRGFSFILYLAHMSHVSRVGIVSFRILCVNLHMLDRSILFLNILIWKCLFTFLAIFFDQFIVTKIQIFRG